MSTRSCSAAVDEITGPSCFGFTVQMMFVLCESLCRQQVEICVASLGCSSILGLALGFWPWALLGC